MIWEIKRKDKCSYLVGASHMFAHSFKNCLKNYIDKLEILILEGPLDKDKMEEVIKIGSQNNQISLYNSLGEHIIERLIRKFVKLSINRVIPSIKNFSESYLKAYYSEEIREILKKYKPWMAFSVFGIYFCNLWAGNIPWT